MRRLRALALRAGHEVRRHETEVAATVTLRGMRAYPMTLLFLVAYIFFNAGIPTVMMFVQSLHGISHNKIEDTKEEHLELAVRAFDSLAAKTIAWLASR